MERFWERLIEPTSGADQRQKYEALAHLAALAPGERRGPIRAIARRWPGGLREAELVGPERCEARRRWSMRLADRAPQSARAWREEGAGALVLWIALHPLIGDVLSVKRVHRAAVGPAELLSSLDPAGHRRWPPAGSLEVLVGGRLSVRSAYLVLAHAAGMSLPELNYALFERTGSWDRRPGDPAWAHTRPSSAED